MLPNFLVIGTYRAGTTWLHEVLKNHPEVYLPAEKEVMYFSRYYDKGAGWYESFFSNWKGQKAVGEICPAYLATDEAPDRIRKDLPDAKLVAIVRKPLEQIVSHYQLRQQRGLTTNSIEKEMDEYPRLLNSAMYYRNLQRYKWALDAGKLDIFFYDDLTQDTQGFLRGVYRSLGLSDHFPAAADLRLNAAGRARSPIVEKVTSKVADMLRRHDLIKVKILLNKTGIPRRIKRLNMGKKHEAAISPELRRRIEDSTQEDRRQLGLLTGRDLSQWL